jgi:hypothetical protein
MARQYKIEVSNDVDYKFFIHDDNKIESTQDLEQIAMSDYQAILKHAENLVGLMKSCDFDKIKITKL